VAIGAEFGPFSPVWAAFALTLLGLLIFAMRLPRARELVPLEIAVRKDNAFTPDGHFPLVERRAASFHHVLPTLTRL
jgi:hypothetical protein